MTDSETIESPRMSLAERADRLPTTPGVYLFKNERGSVLYVGKAQNLRAACASTWAAATGASRSRSCSTARIDVDVVVTPSVKDALLLENELIKRHKPPFNVRLRDDKQYLALRLDPREPWPRLREVRRFADDGADYFGPYTSSVAMHEALSNLRRIFPLRSCSEGTFKDYARRGRPCIEFEMKRCLAPCVGRVDAAAYAELVRGTALFLRGRVDRARAELRARMASAAEAEQFEEAARLRDRIGAVERTVERQQIVGARRADRDVFGLARRGGDVEVHVLHVREGRVIGAQGYPLDAVPLDDGEVMSSFLGQYYAVGAGRPIPGEVVSPAPIDDAGALESWLGERAETRVAVRVPQRGALRELAAMAHTNAELGLTQRLEAHESVASALAELGEQLGLAGRRAGSRATTSRRCTARSRSAAASCSRTARRDKASYRRYRIREAPPDDDYACLREVIARRLARAEREPLPDLLLIDGGKGQLAVVCAALADAGVGRTRPRSRRSATSESPVAARAGARAGSRPSASSCPTARTRSCSRRARARCCCSSACATSRTASRSSSSASCARGRTSPRSSRSCPGSAPASGARCSRGSARCARVREASVETLAARARDLAPRRRDDRALLRRGGGGRGHRLASPPCSTSPPTSC